MPLLTTAQIKDASEAELVETLRAIKAHFAGLDEQVVVTEAKRVLATHGVTHPVRITCGVEEWDNGYFYSGIARVEDAGGTQLMLPERVTRALADALDGPLATVSYNGRPGRFDQLVVDLVVGVVLT